MISDAGDSKGSDDVDYLAIQREGSKHRLGSHFLLLQLFQSLD